MSTNTSKEDIRKVLASMEKCMKKYGLKINKSKTKVMVCSRSKEDTFQVKQGIDTLQRVEEFCYLESKITSDGRSKKEIVSRIAQAKKAFYQKKQLLTANNTSLDIRKRFIKSYIWSLLLYGCETWTIIAIEKRR